MINSELIAQIITSGSIGMVHFWILREIEVLNFFNHQNKDEKFSLLVILTAFNMYFYETLKSCTNNSWNLLVYYLLSFFIALLVEYFLFSLLKKVLTNANLKKASNNKGYSFQVSSLRQIIEDNITEEAESDSAIFAVIFNFDNKLVDSGFLEIYPTDGNEQSYVLKNVGSNVEDDYNIFKENIDPESNVKIYVSIKEKIKIYLFFN